MIYKKYFIFFLIVLGLSSISLGFFYGWKKISGASHSVTGLSNEKTPQKSAFGKDVNPSNASSSASEISRANLERIKLPIILYHYLENVADKNDTLRVKMNIRPEIFEEQLASLKKSGYETVFVRDIPSLIESKAAQSKRVALTFDDGYEDFYTDAFPLLKKHNAKATVYIIVDFIGRPGYLTSPQIEELASSGLVEIGSHTLTHRDLTKLAAGEAAREIEQSKSRLEGEFKISVSSFAYPYGRLNNSLVDLSASAGYSAAVSTVEGWMQSSKERFKLPRLRAGQFVVEPMGEKLDKLR